MIRLFHVSLFTLLALLVEAAPASAQISQYAAATNAHTTREALQVLSMRQVAPGNVVRTLIKNVSLWNKRSIDILLTKSLILLNPQDSQVLASRYLVDKDNPLKRSDLIRWAPKFEMRDFVLLKLWQQYEPQPDISDDDFYNLWAHPPKADEQ